MKFRIPFTRGGHPERLKQRAKWFIDRIKPKRESLLQQYLLSADVSFNRQEYLGIVVLSAITAALAIQLISSTLLLILGVEGWIGYSLELTVLGTAFVVGNQLLYPRTYANRRQRNIERNLPPALEDILVQLNSGIPLFTILVNIANTEYGELSSEFKKAVRKINTGASQIEVLEELGKRNSSPFFRRTLWQISNGMKAGSDMAIVIKDSMRSLNEEQLLQIQTYGNKLNPLVMFYMLISVILPALSITFLTIISSLINLPKQINILLFVALFVGIMVVQVMFLGMMKSVRPSLI